MPVPISPIERLLVRLGIIPPPIVDFVQYAALRMLLAGHRLGVFDALDETPQDLATLSARLGADPAGLQPLLALLQRQGYLTQRRGRYTTTRAASRWLTIRSPHSLRGILGFLDDFLPRLEYLEETIRAGLPPATAYDWLNAHPDRWPAFHDGQRTIADFTDEEVARKVRLRQGPLRLLDVGGSHGLYTIALCRRYPELHAVIFDWPQGVVAAQQGIAESGLADRISTQAGDFFLDSLGSGYDVVLLGNIIHGQKPAAIATLLRRVRSALRPDGTLLIVDQVRTRQPLTAFAGYAAELAGLYLLNELGGALYPYPRLRAWLLEASFGDIRLRRLFGTPGFVLIQAALSPGPAIST